MFFFCKQKTAYEMRISDWSSDVCASDLRSVRARIFDRLEPLALREAEERPLQRLLIIAQRDVGEVGQREKHLKLDLALLRRRSVSRFLHRCSHALAYISPRGEIHLTY